MDFRDNSRKNILNHIVGGTDLTEIDWGPCQEHIDKRVQMGSASGGSARRNECVGKYG
jgi:hypothetical protein